jgi:mono/diheme cytochrome c family protein
LVILALDAPETAFYSVVLPEVNGKGLVANQPPVVRGQMVFANFCSACHGAEGEQGVANSQKRTIDALVAFVKKRTRPLAARIPGPYGLLF